MATPSPNVGEDLSEVVNELWPAILVVGVMVTVHWGIAINYGPKPAAFTVIAAAGAAFYYLIQSGELTQAWEHFLSLDEGTKHMFAIIAVACGYALTLIIPCSAKTKPATASAGQPLGLPVMYPRELPKDKKESFLKIHEYLVQELLEDLQENYEAIPEQVEWMEKMLAYNTKGGKMNRGMGVVDVLRAFAKEEGREITHDEICRGSVLGWCVEWLQAFFLVADDVMDKSLTRRGQPCWYKLPHVQEIAINDSFILESHVFKILKRHFGLEPYYLDMLELFHEVDYQTQMGQLLDLTSQPMDKPSDLTRFTSTRYNMIVTYKTAFYTFYLPCAIGMIYYGVKKPESFRKARDICCRIGTFFQIQDDYLDCFGDPETIGKVGTDIQDNKCSWLVVQALERATPTQKATLLANYAQHDDAKIEAVKKLYRELELEKAYKEYEDGACKEIKELIAEVVDIPHAVFHQFIDKIYGRTK